MKKWAEGRTGAERVAAVEQALRAAGSVTKAALLLGISRRYLTRVLGEIRRRSESHETSGLTGNGGRVDHVKPLGSESRSSFKPLTYPHPAPTFPRVSTAMAIPAEEVKVPTTMAIKKAVKDWAELRALSRKQREGGRGGIARIFEELAEREMAREEEERLAHAHATETAPKKLRKGKAQDGEK